jgi:serine/threonine protein kinase
MEENAAPNSPTCAKSPTRRPHQLLAKVTPRKDWTINDFELGRRLGKGAFGQVYLARERATGYIVCLKIFDKAHLQRKRMEFSIRREIKNQAQLRHVNIVQLLGYFYDETRIYLILEYAARGHFMRILQRIGRFDEQTAAHLLCELCTVISFCHHKHVIHRDLKLENILMGLDGELKLADFGLSVHSPDTARGTRCGTPEYAAPEIVSEKPYDARVDVWSIGILLFEFLVGENPFEGLPDAETRTRIRKGQIEFPSASPVSELAQDLIMAFLQVDPEQRILLSEVRSHPWVVQHLGIAE